MKLRDISSRLKSSASVPLKKKKKKLKVPTHLREARRERDGDRPSKPKKVSGGEGADWATTDASEISGQLESNLQQSSQNRPPEFYLKNSGDKKRIRFRSDEPLAAFYQYTVKVGKDFRNFTKPPGEDLFQSKKNLSPQLKVLWEIIDIDGYVDREGNKVRFIPRYWRVGAKINEQIQAILEQYGSLKNREIVVKRSGQGTKTQYTLLTMDRSKPHPKELAAESLAPKWREYYKPPSIDAQRAVIGSVSDPNAPKSQDDDNIPY